MVSKTFVTVYHENMAQIHTSEFALQSIVHNQIVPSQSIHSVVFGPQRERAIATLSKRLSAEQVDFLMGKCDPRMGLD